MDKRLTFDLIVCFHLFYYYAHSYSPPQTAIFYLFTINTTVFTYLGAAGQIKRLVFVRWLIPMKEWAIPRTRQGSGQ